MKNKVIFIVGPTGVGKTEIGLKLALFTPVAFISADSMQVYRGMDIVTDKLPKACRKKYPHFLIDTLGPAKEYNVAHFCKTARAAIKHSLRKKKLPIVIGGTGLYVNSLVYGIFEAHSKDEGLRRRLQAQASERGSGSLYAQLQEVDPEAASRINTNDLRRIIRALEVYEVTKASISSLQKKRKGLNEEYDVFLFGLRRDRKDLYRRIDQRVDFMVNAGLLDEVRGLLKKRLSKTAYCCIGVREIEGFLKGAYDLNEAVRLIKRNSRRFAKRQMTWFNKNKEIEWIDLEEGSDPLEVARKIYEKIEGNA